MMETDRFALRPVWGEPTFLRTALEIIVGLGMFPAGLLIVLGAVSGAPGWAYPLLLLLGGAGAGALAWWQWQREPGYLLREADALVLYNVLGAELGRAPDAAPRALTLYWVRRDVNALPTRLAARSRMALKDNPPWARLLLKPELGEPLAFEALGTQMLAALRWLGYNTLAQSMETVAAQRPDDALLEAQVVLHTHLEAEPAAFTITRPALRREAGELR